MRCMACGDNMRLVRVEPDRTIVPGFKRHTLKCKGCEEIEQRLVFDRPAKVEPLNKAPPIAVEDEADLKEGQALLRHAMEMVRGPTRIAARSAWMRTVARLRGKSDGD
jgi:hypothetical protein